MPLQAPEGPSRRTDCFGNRKTPDRLGAGTEVDVNEGIGTRPIRINPDPDERISTISEHPDSRAFEDALLLRTWRDYGGNVPRTISDRRAIRSSLRAPGAGVDDG